MPLRAALVFALALLPLLPAAPVWASGQPAIEILSYGRYDTHRTGLVEKGERTATGELRSVDAHRLIQQTDEIAGVLGNVFGFVLRLEDFPPGPVVLTIRTLHPPLTNPETGKTMNVSEYDWSVSTHDNAYFGYTFDYGWEIAEGTWTKQILYNGRVLAEKKFKVVVPIN